MNSPLESREVRLRGLGFSAITPLSVMRRRGAESKSPAAERGFLGLRSAGNEEDGVAASSSTVGSASSMS